MIKKSLLFVTFTFALALHLFPCDCKQIPLKEDIEKSDIILLAKVLNASDNDYQLKIIELLKGQYENDIIKGISDNSCSIFPNQNEIWLIYGKLESNKLIASQCGNSRSFENPIKSNLKDIPPPPPIGYEVDTILSNSISLNTKQIGLNKLKNEILNLKLDRVQKDFFSNQEQLKAEQAENSKNYLLHYVIIGLLVIVIVILIFKLVLRK